jgi:ATP-dependent DNA ligase
LLVPVRFFDLLELDGEEWRERPLEERKAKLERLSAATIELSLLVAPSSEPSPSRVESAAAMNSRPQC